jgi:hypothetical protein
VDNSLPVVSGDDATGPGFGNNDANILPSLTWCDAGPPMRDPASTTCEDFLRSACGMPNGVTVSDDAGDLTAVQCDLLCPGPIHGSGLYGCKVYSGPPEGGVPDANPTFDMDGWPEGSLVFECAWCNNAGRRPAGFQQAPIGTGARRSDAIGQFFARMAEVEAASISAFRAIRRELSAHAAPCEFVEAAQRAMRDEARHARLTRAIARRHGAKPPATRRLPPAPIRSLEELALDNAVEGCVHETFGALVAHFQARHACDPNIARAMRAIAGDETRHAALAWAVARWVDARLDGPARRRVAERRADAQRRLARSASAPIPHALSRVAGLPTPTQARALLRHAELVLWRG